MIRVVPGLLSLLATLILFSQPLAGQSPSLFGERGESRLWLGGQANLILQGHGPFKSPYEGPNSLRPTSERAMSHVFTLYSTYRLTRWSELLVDVESAGGRGISDAFGLAGFTNLDVVRNPQLGSKPYLARAQFHFITSLSAHQEEAARGMLSGFARLPTRYLEVRVGKMGIVDFFDVNNVGGDSHLQFLNWTVDNNGAYDYDAGWQTGSSSITTSATRGVRTSKWNGEPFRQPRCASSSTTIGLGWVRIVTRCKRHRRTSHFLAGGGAPKLAWDGMLNIN